MAKNPRLKDITGQEFGRWTVIKKSGNTKRGAALWLCRCSCGVEHTVVGADLRCGKSVSCGCLRTEKSAARVRTHGASRTRLYYSWQNMLKRCADKDDPNYGGRGIAVCDDWQRFELFQYWAIRAGYSDDLTIERINVDLGYEPSNCTWTTALMQANNRRFVKRASNGIPGPLLARQNGITPSRYAWRVANGWPVDQAATWPVGVRRIKRARNSKGQFC